MPRMPYEEFRKRIPMRNASEDINGEEPANREAYRRTIRYHMSPLFGAQTEQDLARELKTTVSMLLYYAWRADKKYKVFKKNQRTIEAPFDNLKAIQREFHSVLADIDPPDYLAAPLKGGTTSLHARQHFDRRGMAKIDIQKFYPSCRRESVHDFFRDTLKMSERAALLSTNLVCYKGHIPTGAPSSPQIAFHAHEPMFYEIWSNVYHDGCRMSLWIDDINVSEGRASVITPDWLENEVVAIIRRYRFSVQPSKTRIYTPQQAALTTGIIVMPNGEHRMPNRLHLKMYTAKQLSNSPELSEGERTHQRQVYDSLKNHLKYIERGSATSKWLRKNSDSRPARGGSSQRERV